MTKSRNIVFIGDVSFDPETEVLRDSAGTKVALRPQTARVLRILVAANAELVTKEALMESVWPDTHVTDDSLVQCISEIRKALGPKAGRLLKTVPKQGYRLDTEGRVKDDVARTRTHVPSYLAAAILIAVAVVAVTFVVLRGPDVRDTQSTQSIAVMPFHNASGDESQAYYANGLSEELIVKLSQISDLRVVSHGASFSVAGQTSDPRQIAEELEVSYLVEGSVRRTGETLRISASLIEGASGKNLWAQSYAGAAENVFDFQDSVIHELLRVLSVRLSSQERARLGVRGTTDIDAFDHYLQGIEYSDFLTAEDNVRAEKEFLEALRRDPDYAAAHAQLSLVLSMRAEFSWTNDLATTVSRAARHAETAISLEPELPFVHFAHGRLLSRRFVGNLDGAISAFERAIELDRNYMDAYAFISIVQVSDGRAEEGLDTINEALARNPVPPYWYYMPLGLGYFQLEQYDAAETALTELLRRNPNFPPALLILIATYGHMGQLDDAEWLTLEYETLGIPATIKDMMNASYVDHAPYRAAIEKGLRLAGVPD